MNRLGLSAALALLLAASLAVKVSAGFRGSAPEPDDSDIARYLLHAGLQVSTPPPNTDPPWYVGTMPDCRIEIATVSAQGWHRAAVAWRASILGGNGLYVQDGRTLRSQDVLKSTMVHYWRRLLRYLGLDVPDPVTRAVVVAGTCPEAMTSDQSLAVLSH